MSLACMRTVRLLNSRFLSSNYKLSHCYVNKFSTLTVGPTQEEKRKELIKREIDVSDETDESKATDESKETDESKKGAKKKKRERYAVNTYSHNPPGLMEFFDDPKNWAEDYIKSGKFKAPMKR